NASLGATTSHTYTILDNDGPTISIDDVALVEGNSGTTTNFVFTVSLSAASSHDVTVTYATADGTAHGAGNQSCGANNQDYISITATTLTIPAGQTSG